MGYDRFQYTGSGRIAVLCMMPHELYDCTSCIFANQLLDQNIFYKDFLRSICRVFFFSLGDVCECVHEWVFERESNCVKRRNLLGNNRFQRKNHALLGNVWNKLLFLHLLTSFERAHSLMDENHAACSIPDTSPYCGCRCLLIAKWQSAGLVMR